MQVLSELISWGSPLGLALFFSSTGLGAGIFFWGFSHFLKSNKEDEEA